MAHEDFITHGHPTILHGFPAHVTDLEDFHRDELDSIALEIRNGDITGRRIRKVTIVGHAATWRGLSEREYSDRAMERASGARDYLKDELAKFSLSKSPKFEIDGRSDDEPLHDNMVHSTSRTARHNRAMNRRIEIFLQLPKRKRRKRKIDPEVETDWEAFLNTKLRQLEEYWEVHRPFDGDRVHACIRKKLLRRDVDDYYLLPIPRAGAYEAPLRGPYIPGEGLRDRLIDDLKKGFADGEIKRFDRQFDMHVDNAIDGVNNLGFRANPSGDEVYNRRMVLEWKWVIRRSKRKQHFYSCKFFREMIDRYESQNPF